MKIRIPYLLFIKLYFSKTFRQPVQLKMSEIKVVYHRRLEYIVYM